MSLGVLIYDEYAPCVIRDSPYQTSEQEQHLCPRKHLPIRETRRIRTQREHGIQSRQAHVLLPRHDPEILRKRRPNRRRKAGLGHKRQAHGGPDGPLLVPGWSGLTVVEGLVEGIVAGRAEEADDEEADHQRRGGVVDAPSGVVGGEAGLGEEDFLFRGGRSLLRPHARWII